MAEPELPSLDAEDVPTRIAAVRELGLHGKPDIISRLVELARTDASPAIRLATAAAAADILSRYRVGKRAKELNLEERRKLLALFNGIDPGVNSGLFSMLASLGLPEAVGRISIGLRDPRGGVRVGAAVGLLRLVCSVQAHGDKELERRIVALLQDKRLKPDALAEVAEVLCAAVGYHVRRDPRPARHERRAVGRGGHVPRTPAVVQPISRSAATSSDGRDAE